MASARQHVAAPPSQAARSTSAIRPAAHATQRRGTDFIQAKLTVNRSGDRFEQEADRVADAVMSMPSSGAAVTRAGSGAPEVQRKCTACESEDEQLQAKELPGQAPAVSPQLQSRIDGLGAGHPLSSGERAFFEPRFGRNFDDVRIHNDSSAAESARMVNARAFTRGHDVVMGAGAYTPGTHDGQHLLAHELTHVVQQTGPAPAATPSIQRVEPVTDITIGAVIAKCILGALGGALFDAAIQTILYSIKEWTWRFWRATWDYCSIILSAVIGCIAAPISAATLEPWITSKLGPVLGGIEGTLLGKILLYIAKKVAIGIPKFIVKSLAKLGCISPEQAAELDVKPDSPENPPGPTPDPNPPAPIPADCKPMSGDIAGDTRILMKVNTADFLTRDEEAKADRFADTVRGTDAKVRVHGLASTDGSASFNDGLSCTRALKGVQLLRERAIPATQISEIFRHGEVAGPYDQQRSVVFERIGGTPGPVPPGPTPPGPTPPGPTPPGPVPAGAVKLKSVEFTSDHGALKDSGDSWENTGTPFPDPEWQATRADKRTSPISQNKGRRIDGIAVVEISPDATPGGSFTLAGSGSLPFLNFDGSGSMNGGGEQRIPIAAGAPVPDAIAQYRRQSILWSVKSGNREEMAGLSAGLDVFATYDTPRAPRTYKRMDWATDLTEGFGNDPFKIVSEQMKRFPFYNLKNPVSGNIWVLADDIPAFGGKGADCQSIVRFIMAVNGEVGLPGQGRGIAIYASPDAPKHALEGELIEGGGAKGGMWEFPNIALFDAGDNANNYEAALEFTHGGAGVFPDNDRVTRYYPGGTPGGGSFKTKDDVLGVFKQMAEMTRIDGEWRPSRTIWCYEKNRPTC
jgi:outer membrane protein OmpA-like peptidoglycan-associated protein